MEADDARSLKRELGKYPLGRGKRLPVEIRDRVRRYALERRKQGARQQEIADELGLSLRNVQRWSGGGRAMVPVAVEVIAERKATVSIVSPSGYRLEGLGLEDAVRLLRALG